jgi:hypothetical protein
MNELARRGALVAHRVLKAKPPQSPIPPRVRIPETVESANPSSSAI